ncbi:restriction endonuclease subunit S [Campylobacter lari]|uniref:Restriction endonuclease subunit S n=1 Tax=Campylobacter lari TaxID=201 RepID=A0A5L8LM43_CAMLA|nr:restriction endonuclease subunit S [Campylobacter lari]EAK9939743.1 restriction endonuclease subunit S [Campylobacter lari]EHS0799399.1 restriction endonuclease subunit S [Campylobacter lari]MCR2075035.1 restriction endonuclease subunit S [Campylobacter lari subsp. concheus]MCR2082741.1 restriction endonuclease subunit S [Campylobacter lari subsp. concheus]MCR2084412.1 restriction endonuclease subunit S [Campylobacter lari subsp. concheus]
MINLPQGWEVKKLGEIFNIERGGSPRPIKEFLTDKEDGINWIKIGDIKNQKYLYATEEKIIQEGLKKSKLVIEGDLLVSNSMSFGKPVIVKLQKGAIHDGWLLLKEKINLNKEYFYYLFSSNFMYDFLSYQASGSTVKNLNIDKLKQIEIPLPPLQEQERIVGILDESFAKIDESIKILEQDLLNLDELMQSALQKAFNPLKDNAKENYKLPQGWEWKSLGEICFITDGTHKTPNYIKTGIPFLSVKNISKGFFDLSDIKYISLEEHNKLIKRAKPEFGDILICRIGTLGKAIKISLDFEFSIFVSLGLLKPKIKIISDYLVYFLNSYFIEGWIDNNKVGGGTHTAKLNLNILEKCPIALPSLKEQEQIASYLDRLSLNIKDLKQNYQTQIKNLQELKKSLLDKAFKGNL